MTTWADASGLDVVALHGSLDGEAQGAAIRASLRRRVILATNIAETVFYMIEGQQISDKRPKGDMTSFASIAPGGV